MGKIFSNFVDFSGSPNFNKTIKQIKLADCIVYAHFGLLTIFLIDFLTWYSILVPFIQLALNSIRKKNVIFEKSCGEHITVTISKNWKFLKQNNLSVLPLSLSKLIATQNSCKKYEKLMNLKLPKQCRLPQISDPVS